MTGSFRWKARHTVLALLFATSIIAFMDRMVMSVAIPYIAHDFGLGPAQSGWVLGAFFLSYSLSQIPGGMLADRFGVRRVTAVAMLWWSAFTALTGAATALLPMLVTRFLFGLGEGVFPAAAFKTVAVWFPKRERASANAVKFAAGPLGSALSPLMVVGVMSLWGWRDVFYLLFVPGLLITALFWILVPDDPGDSRRVSAAERAELAAAEEAAGGADGAEAADRRATLRAALKTPGVLQYFVALFAFDVAYWGFTTWLPTYLVKARGFSLVEMGLAASLPFFAGTLGSVFGGWASDRLFSRRRKVPIIAMQLLSALLLYLTYASTSRTILVISQTAAGFCLNIFFTAFWALPMTTIPPRLMGVASGLINMAGQIAAFVSPILIGYLVQASGGYASTFLVMVVSILVSCAVVATLSTGRPDPHQSALQPAA